MKTIHKYPLGMSSLVLVTTHRGARFLHVDVQQGQVMVWAEFDTAAEQCQRQLQLVPTGGYVPSDAGHVGTVLLQGGALVLHVYAGVE